MTLLHYPWLKKTDKKRSRLLVDPPLENKKWYDNLNALNNKYSSTSSSSSQPSWKIANNKSNVTELKIIQDFLSKEFQKEEEIYLKYHRQNGNTDVDEKWIREVAQSGTLSDKIAALALIIQESPLHNLHSLETLLNYCDQKREQRSCQLALDALKDLFTHNILPDRHLNSIQYYFKLLN